MDLACAKATKMGAQVILVSEPYRKAAAGSRWYSDLNNNAAIGIADRKVSVVATDAGRGFVWVPLANSIIYSCYVFPNVS